MLKPINTQKFRPPHSALRTRLDTFAQQHPEWRPWLTLLEATLRALDEPVWSEVAPRLRSDRPVAAPLLYGAELPVDGRRARDWVYRLVKTAVKGGESRTTMLAAADLSRMDALALLEAAACQDHLRIQTLADRIGVGTQVLEAVAQLAVMPLLQACGRRLTNQASSSWSFGYCPVCGAWPVLAELRGLERTRRFRCARCGEDWGTTWLRCSYCDEADHHKLDFLLPEGNEESRKVETCATCQGYIKTLTSLQGSLPSAVILEDLGTVDLDVVALERGYKRPERPGYVLEIRLIDAPSHLRAFFGRNS